MTHSKPQLSIIIPTLNEHSTLSKLLSNLATQQGLKFETTIVDGGSTDNTLNICKEYSQTRSLNLRTIVSRTGRAIQMNCAANITTANDILFNANYITFSYPNKIRSKRRMSCEYSCQRILFIPSWINLHNASFFSSIVLVKPVDDIYIGVLF